MIIAFVNKDQQRVMRVDIGAEVDTLAKIPAQVCNFIDLLCDKLNWTWEPLKQVHPNTKLISFEEMKNAINGQL